MFDDIPVALAVSNFAYMGGSMGAVVGEKFRAIVHFALAHHLPLLAITATGGARMQEGTVALVQMAKTTAAVVALRRAGLPYIAVLGHPTLGGVLASYATLADFIIAEAKATLSFAGDRVVKLTSQGRGIPPEMMTAEFFAHHGGIHAVAKRHAMKALIAGVLRMTPWYSMLKNRKTSAILDRKVIGHPGTYSEADPRLLAYKSSLRLVISSWSPACGGTDVPSGPHGPVANLVLHR